jgi:endonuclease/exonuclease/phosphatase family metal-dependent hydrolase
MQWNVHGNIGTSTANSSAGAAAIARILNYVQPDVLLINEVANGTPAVNTTALNQWVSANLPYLATGTFYVAVSTEPSDTQRNAAISRYPILTPFTYPDVPASVNSLRGMHSFQLQLTGTNRLQVFHVHLKCCSTGNSCQTKQDEAQLFGDDMATWASTNSAPYIFGGDLNEDDQNPECPSFPTTLSTIREVGHVVEFKPTMLNGTEYRTWSTTSLSIRFDYIWAATNRLAPYTVANIGSVPPTTNVVFSTMDWAARGLYTNASPANLVNDSKTASDHYSVIVNYFFPTSGGADFTVTPTTAFASSGNPGGPFSPSNQVYTVNNTNTTSLTWGVSKNAPWLDLSATSGTLVGGDSTNITASITNSAANALTGGSYTGTLTFSNATTGASLGRSVNLTVLLPGQLSGSPAGGFTSTGPTGGPFSPPSQSYVLTNTGNSAINWIATNGAAWLNLSPTSGSLAGGASTSVIAIVNANSLAVGSYNDTIGFTNTTNGAGNTTRAVTLTVSAAGSSSFFDDVESGTNGWTAAGLWHIVSTTDASCGKASSPTHAWWYGLSHASLCDYNDGTANSNNLVSPQFTVPASGTLTFQSWEQTEGTTTSWDKRFVYITTNNATSWVQLLQSTDNSAAWRQVTIGLSSYAGKTAKLRFMFTTVNTFNNTNGGWYIDDIRVAGPVPPALTVTPAATVSLAGEQGGPFSPGSQVYVLGNTGSSSLNWTASVSNNWLSLSAASGALGAGATTNITVSTNVNVMALVGGLYSNLVSFVNVTNGAGNMNLVWSLLVRDGISDAWRLQYFGHVDPRADDLSRAQDDPDGDGFTNLQEFLAGTDPTNSASAFTIISITPDVGGVTVTWNSVFGNIYQLQYKDNITDATWNNLNGDVTAGGSTASKLDDTAGVNTQRLYRVLLVQ